MLWLALWAKVKWNLGAESAAPPAPSGGRVLVPGGRDGCGAAAAGLGGREMLAVPARAAAGADWPRWRRPGGAGALVST